MSNSVLLKSGPSAALKPFDSRMQTGLWQGDDTVRYRAGTEQVPRLNVEI